LARAAVTDDAIALGMPKRVLDRIRNAVRLGLYDATKHAVDELAEGEERKE
jgi:hypothetical protein